MVDFYAEFLKAALALQLPAEPLSDDGIPERRMVKAVPV